MHFDRTKAHVLVLTAALVSAGTAFAQTRLPKEIDKQIDLPVTRAVKAPVRNPCSTYGPDFVRVEGFDSCVKVGGSIGVETSRGARGR